MMVEESRKYSGVDQIEDITELARLICPSVVNLRIENLGEEGPILQIVEDKLHCFAVDDAAAPKCDCMNNQADRQNICRRDRNRSREMTDANSERVKLIGTCHGVNAGRFGKRTQLSVERLPDGC